METVRRERRRRAEEDALVEARMWGHSTSPLPGEAADAKVDSATGEGVEGAGEGRNVTKEVETFYVPSEPLWSGEWQVNVVSGRNTLVVGRIVPAWRLLRMLTDVLGVPNR